MGKLVSLGEAAAWICTRDGDAVVGLANEPAENRFRVARQHWAYGLRSVTQWRASLDTEVGKPGKLEPVEPGEFASFQSALTGLQYAIWRRLLPVYVPDTDGYTALNLDELQVLELQLVEGSGASCGLRHKTRGELAYLEPQVQLSDLEKLWPAPPVPATIAMTKVLLNHLLETTANGPLKKDAALELLQKVPGYGRRRFEDAWRKLPADRKIARGKRGPSLKH